MGRPIVYLGNMMMVEQYKVESGVIPAGNQIVIDPGLDRKKPMSGGVVTIAVDGQKVTKTKSAAPCRLPSAPANPSMPVSMPRMQLNATGFNAECHALQPETEFGKAPWPATKQSIAPEITSATETHKRSLIILRDLAVSRVIYKAFTGITPKLAGDPK